MAQTPVFQFYLLSPILIETSDNEICQSLVVVAYTLFAPFHVTPMPCRSSANVVHQIFCGLPVGLVLVLSHIFTY